MEEFLIRYGLAAVALLAIIEGDVVLILAGVIAHLGQFGLVPAIVTAGLGSLIGDTVFYFIGRNRARVIRESGLYQRMGPAAERLADRFGIWQLFAMRLVWGMRMATLLLCGVRGLPFWRFILLDGLSCLVWASVLCTLGYLLSESAEWLIGGVKQVEMWISGATLACILMYLALRRFAQKRSTVSKSFDSTE
ncbi:MAG: DedA family protein [Pyrinomonadaceae bacterium]|nr:DedA family protein [Pyrinomonadaceae bacterium]